MKMVFHLGKRNTDFCWCFLSGIPPGNMVTHASMTLKIDTCSWLTLVENINNGDYWYEKLSCLTGQVESNKL